MGAFDTAIFINRLNIGTNATYNVIKTVNTLPHDLLSAVDY